MCRLFGFRSVIPSQVHSSLVGAENAIIRQSRMHPDGWGVVYYLANAPHVVKSEGTAFGDNLFKKVSGIVSSQTVIAHIRRATAGKPSILNTHPFQYGKWVFAHNGNIKDFEKYRAAISAAIAPVFRRFILGETDSELIFFLIMTYLQGSVNLMRSSCDVTDVAEAVQKAMVKLRAIIGDFCPTDIEHADENYITFLLTNGEVILAHQGGKPLHFSTYKTRCPERDVCASFMPECEAPSKSGYVNHLVFSSEPFVDTNVWEPLAFRQMIGVDGRMTVHTFAG